MLGKETKYDANFTAGGLLFNEFKALEPLLVAVDFETLIKEEEKQNSRIGIATHSSCKWIDFKIIRRFKK